MSSLFRVDRREWDEDLVRDMFSEGEAHIILGIQIQLSQTRTEDLWYWSKEISANYSVKSAYKWLHSCRSDNQGIEVSEVWKKFWKLRVPPKAKDTVWRAGTYCLPTKLNLQGKKVPVNSVCPFCNVYPETISHCLVSCEFSWSCWIASGLKIPSRESISFVQWMGEVVSQESAEVAANMVMICWSIWRAHNDIVWNNRKRSVEVVSYAMLTLNQYRAAQDVGSIPSLSPLQMGDGAERWVKPGENSIKINVDGNLRKGEGVRVCLCCPR